MLVAPPVRPPSQFLVNRDQHGTQQAAERGSTDKAEATDGGIFADSHLRSHLGPRRRHPPRRCQHQGRAGHRVIQRAGATHAQEVGQQLDRAESSRRRQQAAHHAVSDPPCVTTEQQKVDPVHPGSRPAIRVRPPRASQGETQRPSDREQRHAQAGTIPRMRWGGCHRQPDCSGRRWQTTGRGAHDLGSRGRVRKRKKWYVKDAGPLFAQGVSVR